MTTSTVTPEITTFAQGVRAALADLPAEEVDDLTEGLEADLAEAYAEDLQRELPDPSAYAAELRLAAGLPVRTKVKHGVFAGIGESLRDTRRDIGIAIHRNPTLSAIAEFVVSLRPAWWVARAFVAMFAVHVFTGSYGFTILLLPFLLAVSIQWGRGRWLPASGLPVVVGLGNIVAVVLFIPAIVSAVGNNTNYYEEPYSGDPESSLGMTLDSESVTNIFAYGADGQPLTNVQLFDQDGRPLVPHLDPVRDECSDGAECEFSADGTAAAPTKIETGASVGNVFPLSFIQGIIDEMTGETTVDSQAAPLPATAPFLKVPALMPAPKVAEPNQ